MAIVYSYPLNKNIKLSDELVGTTEQMINGRLKTVTRNFLLQDLAEFFIVDGGLQKEITLTTNNTSGAATLDQITGILNIPRYDQGTITPAALTKVNDTNVTLTLGGSPSNALLQGVSLTLGWTGTLNDDRITSSNIWNAKQNAITTGTNLQYLRGDLSLATFPTNISSFTNDSGYITNSALIPYITSATAAATYEPKIIAGTTAQYWRGDKSWQTFPTIPTVGTWGTLNYPTWTTGTPFVKMTATGIFSLDTTIYEPALGNPTVNGYVLSSTTAGVRSWVAQSGGGGNFVPYTGATSGVNLGEFGIQLGNLEFDNTPTNIPITAGSVYYNDSDGTLDLILKGGNVKLQIGQETVVRVVNKTVTNISLLESNYQAVRITGAQGQRPKVDLAQATNDELSAETIGLVTETIANNQEGFITTSGLVRNINTTGNLQGETWLDGDILYLSPTVAGNITKVKPVAPNHLIIIGYVIYAHITQGTIFVKVDNGYELNELHNVKINGVANNNVLAYTSSTSIWENKTIATVLGYTPANDASVVHLTGNETISGLKTFTDNLTAGRYLYSGGSIFPEFGQTFYINGTGATHSFGGGISNAQNNLDVPNGTLKIGLQTASTIASFDANKNVVSLTTANGYPTLTELKSLVGISTTAIQTQLNSKQASSSILSGLSALSFSGGTPFIRMISGSVFTLDTANYLTSVGIYDLTATGTPSATTYLRGDNTWSSIPVPSQSAYTMLANNTASSAVPTEQAFENLTNQTYSGTIVWGPGAAPSTNPQHTYSLSQVGNLVTLIINLSYGAAGASTLTSVACELPSTAPLPALPTSVSVALDIINYGTGVITTSKNLPTTNLPYCALRIKSVGTPNVYEVVVTRGAAAYRYAYATIQYFV